MDPKRQLLRLTAIREQRRREALRLFRPQAHQELVHKSRAPRLLIRGGNQSLCAGEPVLTRRGLVAANDVRVGDVTPFGRVVSRHENPVQPCVRVEAQCGFTLRCNTIHPLLTKRGFVEAKDLRPGDALKVALGAECFGEARMSVQDALLCGWLTGDGCLTHRAGVFGFHSQTPEVVAAFMADMQERSIRVASHGRESDRRFCSVALRRRLERHGLERAKSPRRRIPHAVWSSRETLAAFLRGLFDTDGCFYQRGAIKDRRVVLSTASKKLARDVHQALLALGIHSAVRSWVREGFGVERRILHVTAKGPWADRFMRVVGTTRDVAWSGLAVECPADRWVKVNRVVPIPDAKVYGVTVDPTNTYVTAGLVSHNSGKTLNGAIRFADCATGFERFQPRRVYQGMKLLAVSLDFTLMSDNIYKKLFEPGAFDLCRACHQTRHICEALGNCEDAGDWNERCYEAPPLIPDRFMRKGGVLREGGSRIRIPRDGIAWRDKARLVPERAYLRVPAAGDKDVTVYLDFKSTDQGRKKFQGVQWDGAWFDEEATNDESIVAEVERGLLKRRGWFQVTATPLAAGLTLFQWSEQAEEQRREVERGERAPEDVRYEEVALHTDANKALDAAEIEHFFEGMGEEEERVRRRGEFLVQQGLIYREFDKDLHICEPFEIPWEWTVYDALDPGHANAFAILFAAVDPHGTIWLFDELYMRRPQMREVVRNWQWKLNCGSEWINDRAHWSQRSVIDPNAEQQHAGMNEGSVRKQIHRLRRQYDFRSYDGEHGTFKANNDVQAGIFTVKGLLRERRYDAVEDGMKVRVVRPRLMVFSTLTHTLREIRRYRYARPKEGEDLKEHGKTKVGLVKKDDHGMDCLRYLAMTRPEYVPFEQRPDYYANENLRVGIEKKRRKIWKSKKRRIADKTRC